MKLCRLEVGSFSQVVLAVVYQNKRLSAVFYTCSKNQAMHNIGKVVLQAAVSAVVKEGVSAAVRGATKSRANIPTAATADIQRDIRVIESNVDDIKTRMDGIAMKDLLASASFFNEGLLCLDRVFDKFHLSDFQTITAKATFHHQPQRGKQCCFSLKDFTYWMNQQKEHYVMPKRDSKMPAGKLPKHSATRLWKQVNAF